MRPWPHKSKFFGTLEETQFWPTFGKEWIGLDVGHGILPDLFRPRPDRWDAVFIVHYPWPRQPSGVNTRRHDRYSYNHQLPRWLRTCSAVVFRNCLSNEEQLWSTGNRTRPIAIWLIQGTEIVCSDSMIRGGYWPHRLLPPWAVWKTNASTVSYLYKKENNWISNVLTS